MSNLQIPTEMPADASQAFAQRDYVVEIGQQIQQQMQQGQQFLLDCQTRIAFLNGYIAGQGEDPDAPRAPLTAVETSDQES
jgi:hypothetical protein